MHALRDWRVPLVLVAAMILLVWAAPSERRLGDGIRWVYVHVALVWAGGLGLGLAALLGLGATITGSRALAAWTAVVARCGLVAFVLGVAFSMIAARVNWGAVSLWEPRMAASLRFVALAVIAQGVMLWTGPRMTGALAVATAALLFLDVGGAPLVMHPRDPIRQASSTAIQLTFAGGFAVTTALLTWSIARFRPRPIA